MKLRITLLTSIVGLALAGRAEISVEPAGSATVTFDTLPAVTEWSTYSLPGDNNAYNDNNVNAFDVGISASANVGTTAFVALGTQGAYNQNTQAQWNSAAKTVYTEPTGNGGSLLLAKLTNNTGATLSGLTVTYDLANGGWDATALQGLRVYFSLTGASNSWQLVPALSSATNGTGLSGTLSLGSWLQGDKLYVLWADDNAQPYGPDPYYALDNVAFTPAAPPLSLAIVSPTNDQQFTSCNAVPITLALSGQVTNVAYFLDGNLFATRTALPFFPVSTPFISMGGLHTIQVEARDNTGASVNASVNIVISGVAAIPIAITNTYCGTVTPYSGIVTGKVFAVGTCVNNQLLVSANITNVDFLVNGLLHARIRAGAGNWNEILVNDMRAGTNIFTAQATDTCGNTWSSTNVTVTITNPPPGIAILVTNGSVWRYNDIATDIPTNNGLAFWATNFDDSSWKTGQAELGYGDAMNGNDPINPEATVIFTPPGGQRYTEYFRRSFYVANRTNYNTLILSVLRDDGCFVFLNGVQVFTDSVNPPLVHSNGCPNVADDGRGFAAVTNGLPATLLVNGTNVLAVAVQQTGNGSTDVSFDLMLWATTAQVRLDIAHGPAANQSTVTWADPGYRLQYATEVLKTGTVWHDVPGNPQNVYQVTHGSPIGPFFRLTQ